jgi:hypothetical protein
MKNYFLILLLLLKTLVSFGQTSTKKTTDLVITNVSVITMQTNEVLNNQDVVVKAGKIISITKHSKKKHKDVAVIDGKGKYIMPTLSDAHVHFPENEADLEKNLQLNLINGVTKLRSMRGEWKHVDWRKKYNTANSFYPKLYLSAPPIYRNYDLTTAQIEDFVKISKEKGFDLIKILSIKSQPIFSQLDSVCKIYNMNIGGHYPKLASGNEINEALLFNSNYTSFEHLGGLAGENPETISRRIDLLKEKKMVICPTLSWYSIGSGRYTIEESLNLPGMEFVPKTTIEEWVESTKKYREKMGEVAYKEEVISELKSLEEKYQIIKKLNDAGVPMLLSPDASSQYMIAGFSVLGEMELLQNANLSNYEILKMATVNFAAFFKEDYGTIEINKIADFMLLDANPLEDLKTLKNLQGIYYNQNFLDKKALDVMRESVLKALQN